MNYDELIDHEINKMVAEKLGISYEAMDDFSPQPYVWNETLKREFDPCNNWSDIGPIIFNNKISLIEPDELTNNEWGAGQVYCAGAWANNKNPLRAAAICFLMMQESK